MARPGRFEHPTCPIGAGRSIQLNYGRNKNRRRRARDYIGAAGGLPAPLSRGLWQQIRPLRFSPSQIRRARSGGQRDSAIQVAVWRASQPWAVIRLRGAPSTGGDKRDRTADPLLAKEMLSQLSYVPEWVARVRPRVDFAFDAPVHGTDCWRFDGEDARRSNRILETLSQAPATDSTPESAQAQGAAFQKTATCLVATVLCRTRGAFSTQTGDGACPLRMVPRRTGVSLFAHQHAEKTKLDAPRPRRLPASHIEYR